MNLSFCNFILPAFCRLQWLIAFSLLALDSMPISAQAQKTPPRATPVTEADGLIKRSGVIPKEIPTLPTTSTDPNAATWERNPHRAFAKAKARQKPLLLLFTAQWNTVCHSLSSEVFSSKTFNRYAKENLVICYIDFPRDPLDIPDALRKLKEKFKVHGLPVLLVFDTEGHVVQQFTGYSAGRPVDYFNNLKAVTDTQLADISEKRKRLVAQGYREWKNTQGQQFFALFVQRSESSITLKSYSGENSTIEIKTLSPADRLFVQSLPIIASKK
ncbi:MAG: thioredoxin family protein [Verrucomicrobia bacterium]|nr:thioredoxin family protein [Verrucomicrobiota bacterium]